MNPHERLRHHISGAIERGEAEPIIEQVPTTEGNTEQCRLMFSDGSRCQNDCAPQEQYCADCCEFGLTDWSRWISG